MSDNFIIDLTEDCDPLVLKKMSNIQCILVESGKCLVMRVKLDGVKVINLL